MIEVNDYKIFHGVMRIISTVRNEPFEVEADWVYNPKTKIWYGNETFYIAEYCQPISETQKLSTDEVLDLKKQYGIR